MPDPENRFFYSRFFLSQASSIRVNSRETEQMMNLIREKTGLTLLFLLLVLLVSTSGFALEAPPLRGRINDTAAMLSAETVAKLEQKLATFERETSNQIAVLTIQSLQGDDINQFSIRVAENWKLGQTGKDNGVVLILAKTERKVRIEVGMGLQGALPDITASKIIREVMRPHLKNNDFDQGISAGIDSIIAATKGEFKATAAPQKQSHKKSGGVMTFLLGLVLTAVIALFIGAKSRVLSSLAGGAGMPLAALSAFTGTGMLTIALLALAGLIGGYLISLISTGMTFGSSGRGGYYGGGWGGGGFYDGGSSSDSSDVFSGGGGDFDGGGSSDDY